MFDPAALGTLLIGLRSASSTYEGSDSTVRRPARRSRTGVATFRVSVANTLRSAADRLDRAPSVRGTSQAAA